MSAENFSVGSRIDFEIDDKTVRKHGSHDGEFDVEYDRIVPNAVDEVSTSAEQTASRSLPEEDVVSTSHASESDSSSGRSEREVTEE